MGHTVFSPFLLPRLLRFQPIVFPSLCCLHASQKHLQITPVHLQYRCRSGLPGLAPECVFVNFGRTWIFALHHTGHQMLLKWAQIYFGPRDSCFCLGATEEPVSVKKVFFDLLTTTNNDKVSHCNLFIICAFYIAFLERGKSICVRNVDLDTENL